MYINRFTKDIITLSRHQTVIRTYIIIQDNNGD